MFYCCYSFRDPVARWHGTDFVHIGAGSNVSSVTSAFRYDNFVTPETMLTISENNAWVLFISSLNNRNVGFNLSVERRAEISKNFIVFS